MRPLAELGAAAALLTRLPGALLVRGDWPAPAQCVWAYPLVGLIVGTLGAFVLTVAERAGVPPLAAAVLAIAAAAWTTGGLHEDGLADTFDALGGRTIERRLAIMRDSRIGAHGALALLLVLMLKVAALGSMPAGREPMAFLVATILGRASMLIVIAALPPARAEGLALPLAGAPGWRIAAGLMLALALTAVLDRRPALPAIAATLAGLGTACFARRRFAGFTGDVLGTSVVMAEAAALLAIR